MGTEEQAHAGLHRLYREHGRALLRVATAVTGDAAVAEDLVHDAFVRLHRTRRPPRPGREAAYLRRTVVNLAHDHHRHIAVVRRAPVEAAPDAPSAERRAADGARDAAVAAAVAALPRRQRECIVLHYFGGLTDAEVARDLGISTGAVKTHLHRARAALATRLEDHR